MAEAAAAAATAELARADANLLEEGMRTAVRRATWPQTWPTRDSMEGRINRRDSVSAAPLTDACERPERTPPVMHAVPHGARSQDGRMYQPP